VATASFQLLSDGLLEQCRNDSGADRLITPRREEILSLLIKYITEIELCNPALSLVGTSDRQELIIRHILDSLAPLGFITQIAAKHNDSTARQLHIADVGSGAGLPGIPLAIVMPDAEFTLIERKGRRAGFLRNTQTALGLSHVTVEEAEMEKAPPGRFDVVTFRAFKPLEPKIVKKLFRLCGEGGVLAAYKGRREKIDDEMTALETAQRQGNTLVWEVFPCPVPFLDEERHLVVIKLKERKFTTEVTEFHGGRGIKIPTS
jgi:16S rRNA (guanine527-N7)-methyltransferase